MGEGNPVKWAQFKDLPSDKQVDFLLERSKGFLNRIYELEEIIAMLNCSPQKLNEHLHIEANESRQALSRLKHKYDILVQENSNLKKDNHLYRLMIKSAEYYLSGTEHKLSYQISKRNIKNGKREAQDFGDTSSDNHLSSFRD